MRCGGSSIANLARPGGRRGRAESSQKRQRAGDRYSLRCADQAAVGPICSGAAPRILG